MVIPFVLAEEEEDFPDSWPVGSVENAGHFGMSETIIIASLYPPQVRHLCFKTMNSSFNVAVHFIEL